MTVRELKEALWDCDDEDDVTIISKNLHYYIDDVEAFNSGHVYVHEGSQIGYAPPETRQ